MKSLKYLVALMGLAGAIISCSEDEQMPSGNSAKVGSPISFSAKINNGSATRTSYGELTEKQTYPIYWVNNDQVKVYSPQAQSSDLGGGQIGTYTVTESGSDTYVLTTTGTEGLYWGAGPLHDFYTFYPADLCTGFNEDGDVSFTYPVKPTFTDKTTDNTPENEIIRVDGTDTNNSRTRGSYAIETDMKYALMAGLTSGIDRTNIPEVISLPFNPIMTAVNIQFAPPSVDRYLAYDVADGAEWHPQTWIGKLIKGLFAFFGYDWKTAARPDANFWVDKIVISSSNGLSGDFQYSISEGITAKRGNGNIDITPNKSILIGQRKAKGNKDKAGSDFLERNVNLLTFLPLTNQTDVTVTVYFSQSLSSSQSYKYKCSKSYTISGDNIGKRIDLNLGNLPDYLKDEKESNVK